MIYDYNINAFKGIYKKGLSKMSTNISKAKREELLRQVGCIRNKLMEHQDENTQQLLVYLSNIERDIDGKKYGLIFEEHHESVDELLENNVPVLIEDESLKIENGGQINFLIEGDNLATLKLLEKTHKGKIDVIYIDPPYNTGNKDFIYDDVFVGDDDKFRHSKWLSFMENRLKLAHTLLSNSGLLFISIDDNEYADLKLLCDSIINEKNYITTFVRKTKSMTGDDGRGLNIQHEYLLCYAKNKQLAVFIGDAKAFDGYSNPDADPNGIWCSGDPSAKSGGASTYFPIVNPINGHVDYPPKGRYWAFSKETLEIYIKEGRIKFKEKCKENQRGFIFKRYAQKMGNKNNPVDTLYFADNSYMNSVATTELKNLFEAQKFSYPKPVDFIKDIIRFTTKPDSIVLDFFAGSGTTGHAVMKLNAQDGGNRKFIICTNNENNICRDVTYGRIKCAIEKEGYKSSLKYFKVDFVPISERVYYEYADELLLHIKELVELENGLDFDGNKTVSICLSDEDLQKFLTTLTDGTTYKMVYVGHDVFITPEIENKLSCLGIRINMIPDYYYGELNKG